MIIVIYLSLTYPFAIHYLSFSGPLLTYPFSVFSCYHRAPCVQQDTQHHTFLSRLSRITSAVVSAVPMRAGTSPSTPPSGLLMSCLKLGARSKTNLIL